MLVEKQFTTKNKLVGAFERDNNAPPSIINRCHPIPTFLFLSRCISHRHKCNKV
jgi:hypothetical protein